MEQAKAAQVARNGEWMTASVDDETVMMSVSDGRIVGVNAIGARIWDLIEQPREIGWLREALIAEFDVSSEQCAAELDLFLADLAKRGAIVRQ